MHTLFYWLENFLQIHCISVDSVDNESELKRVSPSGAFASTPSLIPKLFGNSNTTRGGPPANHHSESACSSSMVLVQVDVAQLVFVHRVTYCTSLRCKRGRSSDMDLGTLLREGLQPRTPVPGEYRTAAYESV